MVSFGQWFGTWFQAPQFELGLIYGLLALGVFLTYRILNFADLTVDSSFTTGAGTAAVLIAHQVNPWLATIAGFAAGALAGLITGLLHTKLKIDPLLASILTMIALWSVNLRIMGKANVPIMRGTTTVFTGLRERHLIGSWWSVLILAVVALACAAGVTWFLSTNFGLAIQATGDNPPMASSMGVSVNVTKVVTLMVANGLVGLSGALIAQYDGRADISMGVGLILVGLASVIVGNAILGTRFMFLAAAGVVVGSLLYRLVIFWALKWDFLSTNDMKLIAATLVALALVVSQSAKLRGAIGRHSPFRRKDNLPEPMLAVPGKAEEA